MTSPSRTLCRPVFCLAVAGAAMLGLLAAGCADRRNAAIEPPLETLSPTKATADWTALGPAAALVRLPDAEGRAISVRQRRLSDGIAQEIMLPTAQGLGRNRIELAVGSGATTAGPGPIKPTETGIRDELAAAFPDRTMRIVGRPRHNAFGPYGMAIASGPRRERCVYAWQWLDGDDPKLGERLGGSVSWRARICRSDASLDQIAANLDRIDLGLSPQAAREARQPAATPPGIARKARPVHAAALKPKAALDSLETGSTPAPGGRRYLAPVSDLANSSIAPRLPTAVDGKSSPLDVSLPAEAYRGPSGRTGLQTRLPFKEAAALPSAVPRPD